MAGRSAGVYAEKTGGPAVTKSNGTFAYIATYLRRRFHAHCACSARPPCWRWPAAHAAAQILIGQTAGITGSVATGVNETIFGAQLAIDAANAQGGVHGEKIEMVRMDDGFDVKRAGENARVLIEEKKVVALFMSRGTPHSQAIIPWLDKHGVALIGPSTGAMVLHRPLQKHVFNVRATYQREAEKAVAHLLTIGLERIAVVHVADSFGKDGLEGAMTGFDKAKAKPAVVLPADRDKPDYAAIVPKIAGRPGPGRGVDRLRHRGGRGRQGAARGGLGGPGGHAVEQRLLGLHQAAGRHEPRRDRDAGLSQRALHRPPDGQGGAGAGARQGPATSCRRPRWKASPRPRCWSRPCAAPARSRHARQVLAALEGLRNFDLGGGLEVSYSPQDHSGIDFADLSIISDGKFKR